LAFRVGYEPADLRRQKAGGEPHGQYKHPGFAIHRAKVVKYLQHRCITFIFVR
jgi:hypothetical protein